MLLMAVMASVPPVIAQGTGAWVPFEATFVRTDPGQRRVVGWFHRGADGSTREESNADGPSRPVILIMNIAKRLQYRFEDEMWNSYPVYLPREGWRPPAVERDPRKYRPAPAIDKLAVFRFVDSQGLVLFVAPALNDFSLRTERPNGGREIFSNVLLRDQPAGLFEPPEGVAVESHPDASGAIFYPAGENPLKK